MSEVAVALNDTIIPRAINAYAIAKTGNAASACASLTQLCESSGYLSPYWKAFAASAVARRRDVFKLLTEAVRSRDWMLLFLRHDPAFSPFRTSLAFGRIVRRVGLP